MRPGPSAKQKASPPTKRATHHRPRIRTHSKVEKLSEIGWNFNFLGFYEYLDSSNNGKLNGKK
jgi:hypothetical protein